MEFEDMAAGGGEAFVKRVEGELVEVAADEVLSTLEVDRQQMSQTWEKALAVAVRSSPIRQFGASFGAGWLSGYLFRKVSRLAAVLVGCSFLAIQGASMLGLIKVNWRRLGLAMQDRLKRVPSLQGEANSTLPAKVMSFCQQNAYITSGFATGAVVAFII